MNIIKPFPFLKAIPLAVALLPIPVQAQDNPSPEFNLERALRDGGQRTTIAFSGLAIITGNLEAQSFFPPGKVADYWGFQYLRDNDPDNMGHNTSFLTRVACNVLYILNDEQIGLLKDLAARQVEEIEAYGLRRFTLMKVFRRLVDGDLPNGADDLDMQAVIDESRALYLIDGQISFDRAIVFCSIYRSLDSAQKAWLDEMVGKGWESWPPKTMNDVRAKLAGLTRSENVAVMTYAGDIYSWYAGSLDSDLYFCPERHGTYYGGFYIKDAPAMGVEGYSIDEELTKTAGSSLSDSSLGYVTPAQAQLMADVVDVQRDNLYGGVDSIVSARTRISTALRGLIRPSAPSEVEVDAVRQLVMAQSALYGELDGENNYHYARAFAALNRSLSGPQRTALQGLRKTIMSGTYANGTPFDFSVCTTPFLYSAAISDLPVLDPYIGDTDHFFNIPNTAPWGTVEGGWLWSPLGWTHDGNFPFVYVATAGCWGWIPPFATAQHFYCYLFDDAGFWVYTGAAFPGWVFSFGGSQPGWKLW
jgi:hypothetical protein